MPIKIYCTSINNEDDKFAFYSLDNDPDIPECYTVECINIIQLSDLINHALFEQSDNGESFMEVIENLLEIENDNTITFSILSAHPEYHEDNIFAKLQDNNGVIYNVLFYNNAPDIILNILDNPEIE
jgi:hypothetical protein